MRRLMLMAAGGAIGYVLGARAGRPAYDNIVAGWNRMTESSGLSRVTERMGRSADELKDAAMTRAAQERDGVVDKAADAMAQTADKVRGVDLREEPATAGWGAGATGSARLED